MWDYNIGSGDNRDPTLGQPISYGAIFLRGDSDIITARRVASIGPAIGPTLCDD